MSDDPLQNLIDWIRGYVQNNDIHALLIALAILVITMLVSRFCTAVMRRFLRHDGSPLPAVSILVNVARVVVWLTGLTIILAACFNVNVSGVVTALGVGGIAVSLGLQGTFQNFFGGLQITLMKIIKPGDHIIVGSTEGIVEDVSWRQTVVRDFEGYIHLIPNSVLNSEEVAKVSPSRLVVLPITFSNNGQDLQTQLRQMRKDVKVAVGKVGALKAEPQILLTTVGSGSVTANLRLELQDTRLVREATNAAMQAVAGVAQGPLSQPPAPADDEESAPDGAHVPKGHT